MSAAILCQVPLFGSMLHRSQSGIVLDRKLFLWLASHSIGGLRVPRVDLMHLRNALYLDVRPKTWIAGLRNVAPESGEETLEIDVVRRALSLADIYFSDAQWRSLLNRVRDAQTIEIPSDAGGDAPEQIGVFAADPAAAAHIVVAHAAQPVGNPEPAANLSRTMLAAANANMKICHTTISSGWYSSATKRLSVSILPSD